MSPEEWNRIREIFLAAVEIAGREEQARFLDEACRGDEELRREVETLIREDAAAEGLLSRPLLEASGIHDFARAIEPRDPAIGLRLGAYKIVREIGAGGMGAVYLAERADGSFQKRVAVKLVKRGMDTRFILRRFRQERQILAGLNHPFIASLLDGGTTDDGLPYFVMEYVEGEPLYRYCDSRRLTISERLRLFRQICEAVEYAHAYRVVHRDLKPSNIVIKIDGTPRLLDFGIAKVFNPDLKPDTTVDPTGTAMRLMTPEYASPEQVRGEAVTAASDIYSLGVLLYELLTGHRPYRFKSRAAYEIARVVCEEDPPRPSLEIAREDNFVPTGACRTPEEIYRGRGSGSLEQLKRELAGDLERIVLKSLRKDPAERYRSAAALAADIANYLEKRPVTAETFPDEAKDIKITASSNPAGNFSIAVLPLAIAGAVGADEEYLGVGLADALVSRLSKVQRFVVRPTSSVLKFQREQVDPFDAGRELGVQFVVEGTIRRAGERLRVTVRLLSVAEKSARWADSFDEKMKDVLEIEDSISERVAATLVPHLTGDEQRRISKRGTNDPQAYQAFLRGRFFWNQFTPETFPKALEFFERAVALDPDYALAYAGIADYYRWAMIFGLYTPAEGGAKARAAVRRALEIDDQLAEAIVVLGFIKAFSEFEWQEGERLLRRAIALNPNYGLAHELYSALLAGTGRVDQAVGEILLAEKLEPLSVRAVALTGWHLYQNRRFAEALAKSEEIIEMNPLYFLGRLQRGNLLIEFERAREAVAELEQAIRLEPRMPSGYYMLCFALVALDRREEARRTLRALENLPQSAAVNAYHLGMAHAALGERDRAFEWFNKGIDERQEWFVWLATDVKLDFLRDDPRFDDLLRRTNRPLLARKPQPRRASTAKSKPKTFAVLPFKTSASEAAGESNQEERFLSIGLADSLITRLSQIRSLILRPTSSVIRYLELVDPAVAARELNAEYVLDGSVRCAGGRVRVTARLFDVKSEATAWAETFDEDLTDLLELEDSISARVALSLLPKLSGEEEKRLKKRGTNSPEAYEAYLRGRYYANLFADDALPKAVEAYREAVRLDPDYGLPHVGIADFYVLSAIFGVMPPRQAYPLAKAQLQQALRADNQLAEAYSLSAFVSLLFDWNWAEAERLVRRALELNPNYHLAHDVRAHILASQGIGEEAVAEIEQAEELDPLSPRAKLMSSCICYQSRRFDRGAAKAEEALSMQPDSPAAFLHLGNSLMHAGGIEKAVEVLSAAARTWGMSALPKYMLCHAVAPDRSGKAREILNEILRAAETQPVKPYFVAMACVAVGEIDLAFEWFEKAVGERDDWMIWFGTDVKLDPLRTDPRYFEILRRTNNPIIDRQRQTA